MRFNRKLALCAAAAAVCLGSSNVRAATTYKWSGEGIAGSDWSDFGVWGLATFTTPQPGDEADFPSTGVSNTPNLDTNRSIGTLSVTGGASDGDYVFTGSSTTLTVTSDFFVGGTCFPTISTGLTINATEFDVAPTTLLTISGGGSVSTPKLQMNSAGTEADINIDNQGTLTLSSTALVEDGTLALDSGGTLKMSSGAVLNVETANGFVSLGQGWSLPSGATVNVLGGGTMAAKNNLDIATSGAGTLLVNGPNSSLTLGGTGAVTSNWVAAGGNGSITISGSGVVNAKSGLHIATSGGTANVSIKTGGELIVANGLAIGGGGTSAATLTLNNATLQIAAGTTAFATFGLGSTFNFQSGTVQLAGNATFNVGSVFNWSGGTINATGKTLGVSAGAATFTWGGIAVNNNTISVTNGGSLNVGSVAGTGPAGFAGTITLNGGTLNTIGTATFVSGTTVNASNISGLNLGDNSTFASGSSINLGGIFFTLPSGKTLTVDGGAVTDTRNLLLDSNETLQIQNGGHWDAVQEDLGGGTLLVTGSGSRFTSSSGTFASEWGGPGLNVTFTNGGIGTFAGRVDFGGGTFSNQMSVTAAVATFGGLTSGANTTVNGVTGATTFSIGFGAQLAVTGTAQFNNGAVVNNSGILRLGGNTTFSTGSTCNLSGIGGQLVMGSGTTLTFNGGVGSFATSPLDVDLASGGTLRVTNAGMIMSTTEVGIANDAATGTLLVDSGSTFSVNSTLLPCFWGTNTGNVATVNFSSNSVGTILPGVLMSTSGGNSIVNILSGAKLTTGSLTMGSTGATASLTINGGSLNVTGSATLNNGGQIFLQAGSLTVGGTLTVNSGGGINDTFQLLRLGGLSMSGTGTIDLQSASMIVSNTALSTIKGYVSSGYAGGLWIGSGILSLPAFVNPSHNTGLGYASAGSIGLNTFAGQSVNPTDTLIRYTYYGDTNLDGKVNALDFNALATNFGKTPGSDVWSQGDFNFDGTVNTSDFTAMAGNFNATPLSDPPVLGTLVPEPTTIASWVALGALLRRRRVANRLRTYNCTMSA